VKILKVRTRRRWATYPRIQDQLAELELEEFEDFFRCIDKIRHMTWAQVLATSSKTQKRGLNWEVIPNQKTTSGAIIASIRVTRMFRARVTRDGTIMRFISLHPDHESAYHESGGENL
jgi:hypothetical protein